MSEPPFYPDLQMRRGSSLRRFEREDQIVGLLINVFRSMNTLSQRIDELSGRQREFTRKQGEVMANLRDLLDGVNAMTTEMQGMDQLLDNLIETLKQNQNDPAEVQRILDVVEANRQAIRDNVAQHTPSEGGGGGEEPPPPSPSAT